MNDGWRIQAHSLSVLKAAKRLGLTVAHGRIGPCPACGAKRYKNERRPPVQGSLHGGAGWICNTCKTTGDVVDLVSWVLLSRAGSEAGSRFAEVRRWFEDGQGTAEIPQSDALEEEVGLGLGRVPEPELRRVLEASTPLHRTTDPRVIAWAVRRGFAGRECGRSRSSVRIPAFVLPRGSWSGWAGLSKTYRSPEGRWSSWWSRPWATRFPVVVPAYTGLGELAGLHGRAVTPEQEAQQKTTWAAGCSSRGLVFADPWRALPALRGRWEGVKALLFVEGLTDYLTAASEAHGLPERGLAVLGVESGSASAVGLLRGLPSDVKVLIGTHCDKAGDAYAEAILGELAMAHGRSTAYRLPLWLPSEKEAA